MHVIGTAGHVDHGKSTLVRALSGMDPDRLKEEKARGMTIDLGFAWIKVPGVTGAAEDVGIVDVPGHIDFIKNMLAGVGGIDAVLLIVAADEGVMPQTREHLAIVDLLAIPAGVVVITKTDTVADPEWLDLVELDIAALLEGTRLAHAPVVRVSAQTGAGLEELRTTLARILAALPERRTRARPRLPVDRVFTLSGFGTVVTGTLLDGTFGVGDAVEVLPRGLPARIRGLQTHRQQVSTGLPGGRLAANLSGVEAADVRRGDVVARPGQLRPTTLLDAHLTMLQGARTSLRHDDHIDLFVGAAEVRGRVRVLAADAIEPGGQGWVQLALEHPVVVVTGDRFVVRIPSPSATVGGGVVLDPHPGRKWRRFDAAAAARFQARLRGAPDDIVSEAIGRMPLLTRSQVLARVDLEVCEAAPALELLLSQGAVIALAPSPDPVLMDGAAWQRLVQLLNEALTGYHRDFPLRQGMPRSEVRSRLQPAIPGEALSPRNFALVLDACLTRNLIEADEERVWLPAFVPTPGAEQRAAVERTLAAFAALPSAPPNWGETLTLLGGDAELLDWLVAQGTLVRTGGDVLFLRGLFDQMVASVLAHLAEHGAITMAEARDLLGSSRKYVQALLEEMDSRRLTRRVGDARVLR